METLRTLIELLSTFPHRIKTKQGGVAILIAAGFLAHQLRLIPIGLLSLAHLQVQSGWVAVLWIALCLILALGFWLLWSGRIILGVGNKKIVAFCIEHKNPRIHSYYVQSLDLLKSFLAECGLSNEIIVRDIGSDLIYSDNDAARYALRKSVATVFHGRLFLDREAGDYIHHYNFRVTSRNPPKISQEIAKLLEVDSNLFCSNRDWNIKEIDSKNDQQKIAGAFREIVLFMVVVSQLTDRKSTAKNIEVLEKLSRLIAANNEGIKVTVKAGEKVPKEAMPFLREGRVNALLRDLYLDYAGIRIREGDYKTAHQLLTNALAIPTDKSGAIGVLVPLAVCCYHLKEVSLAKKHSQDIAAIDSTNPHSLVNMAFLEIVDQNYDQSLFYYKKFIFGQYQDEQLVTQVIEFLDQRLNELPNEHALRFAIGVINFAYFDPEMGKTDLRSFVGAVGQDPRYRQMGTFANNLLTRGLEGARKHLQRTARKRAAKC